MAFNRKLFFFKEEIEFLIEQGHLGCYLLEQWIDHQKRDQRNQNKEIFRVTK